MEGSCRTVSIGRIPSGRLTETNALVCPTGTNAAGFMTMYDAPFMITSMAVGVPALLPGRLLILLLLAVEDGLLMDALEGTGENMIRKLDGC
jgi:hypothetical protein